MHPLMMIGTLAAGAYALAQKAPAPPPLPPVDPKTVAAATAIAKRRMADGATPEEAASYAAQVAEQGNGFWKDTSQKQNSVMRF
jgi:hypothetical protein